MHIVTPEEAVEHQGIREASELGLFECYFVQKESFVTIIIDNKPFKDTKLLFDSFFEEIQRSIKQSEQSELFKVDDRWFVKEAGDFLFYQGRLGLDLFLRRTLELNKRIIKMEWGKLDELERETCSEESFGLFSEKYYGT